jgi:hypothetical protein
MIASQSGSRNSRHQQPLRSTENRLIQTNIMPQIAANFLPKTPVALDTSLRNQSANTMPRQRTGLLG